MSGKRTPATYLDDDWQPSESDRAYAVRQGFSEAEIARMADDFLAHFTTRSDARAKHRLWDRVWQRWVRTTLDNPRFRRGNVVPIRSEFDQRGADYLRSLERLKTG